MDFHARSCWIYEGTDPDIAKAQRYGIWYIYIDPRSSNAAQVISNIRAAGLFPGAYFAKSWNDGLSATAFAQWVSDTLNSVLPKGTLSEAPPCMLDLETQDVNWVNAMLDAYRSHQPNRPTSYTNAPFQGGYVPYAKLVARSMPFYVQLYYGDMTQADPPRALLEAVSGFENAGASASGRVYPFYDGAKYTTDQDSGCQYTLERMA